MSKPIEYLTENPLLVASLLYPMMSEEQKKKHDEAMIKKFGNKYLESTKPAIEEYCLEFEILKTNIFKSQYQKPLFSEKFQAFLNKFL